MQVFEYITIKIRVCEVICTSNLLSLSLYISSLIRSFLPSPPSTHLLFILVSLILGVKCNSLCLYVGDQKLHNIFYLQLFTLHIILLLSFFRTIYFHKWNLLTCLLFWFIVEHLPINEMIWNHANWWTNFKWSGEIVKNILKLNCVH